MGRLPLQYGTAFNRPSLIRRRIVFRLTAARDAASVSDSNSLCGAASRAWATRRTSRAAAAPRGKCSGGGSVIDELALSLNQGSGVRGAGGCQQVAAVA